MGKNTDGTIGVEKVPLSADTLTKQENGLVDNAGFDVETLDNSEEYYRGWKHLLPFRSRVKNKTTIPLVKASALNFASVHWLTPFIWRSYKKGTTEKDLYRVPKVDSAEFNCYRFEKFWNEEVKNNGKEGASVAKALMRLIKKRLIIAMLFTFLFACFAIVGPAFFLRNILKQISEHVSLLTVLYIVLLFVCLLLRSILFASDMMIGAGSGVRGRGGVLSYLFHKILTLQNSKKSIGEMVNLCSNDGQRLFEACALGGLAFAGLASLGGAAYAIHLLGWWGILGFAIFALFLPLQVLLSKLVFNIRRQAIPITDERVKLMSEVINSIKLVKMYAWEKSFSNKIAEIRQREQAVLFKSKLVSSLSTALPLTVPLFASALTFISMTMTGNELTATKAFVFISLLNALRFTIGIMPHSMRAIAEGKHACQRIKEILILENEPLLLSPLKDGLNDVEMRNASFGWPATPMNNQSDDTKSEGSGNNNVSEKKKITLNGQIESDPLMVKSFKNGQEKVIPITNRVTQNGSKIVETLHDITFTLRHGSLLGVCGSVGSGKSSLIQAVLKMMNKTGGELALNENRKIAYVSQQAWILNATVRHNILLGAPFDKERYDRVVEVCALSSDFKQLINGDETEIGDRGINLSGGQKQRISIARAVYSDADVILLDDPLSAVDAHVGQHIFNKCIREELADKTVLFVSHQLQFLTDCDYVLVMKDGSIIEEGTHNSLMSREGEYNNLIKSFHESDEQQQDVESIDVQLSRLNLGGISKSHEHIDAPEIPDRDTRRASMSMIKPYSRRKSITVTSNRLGSHSSLHVPRTDVLYDRKRSPSLHSNISFASSAEDFLDIITENNPDENEAGPRGPSTESGTADASTVVHYLKAAGGICVCLLLYFIIAVTVGSNAMTNWWLSYWIKQGGGSTMINSTELIDNTLTYKSVRSKSLLDNPELHFYIYIYSGLLVCSFLMLFVKSFTFTKLSLNAASRIHDQLFRTVVNSPMSFFDVTPSGQILNRFSKDMDELDVTLPFLLEQFLNNCTQVLISLMIIASIFPYFLIALVFIFIVFILLYSLCRKAIREIKRVENTTRSPLYSLIATAMQGLPTIRAYKQEPFFQEQLNKLQDTNNMALFLFTASMRWAAVRLDTLSLLVVFITALLVTFVSSDVIAPAYAALALSYSMNITGLFQYTMRLAIEAEARFSSVERIKSYIDKLDSEAPAIVESNRPDAAWPRHGAITFDDIKLRYADSLPLVIKGISAEIKPQEKIGIVGRTGSGKSSLGQALFRMVELNGGSIHIDGVDITEIGLEDLRSKLAIIPQDPVLFVGTVKYNLDPFNIYNEEELWMALEKCHVKPTIQALEGQLQAPIVENGENLSVGERQLLCMARAFLRHSKILLLDEATAAIDTETDVLIQETIKEAFSDCTMLTIAHRLNTVVNSDRIMVLDNGKLVEFDTPSKLLSRKESLFAQMYALQESQKHAAISGQPTETSS